LGVKWEKLKICFQNGCCGGILTKNFFSPEGEALGDGGKVVGGD